MSTAESPSLVHRETVPGVEVHTSPASLVHPADARRLAWWTNLAFVALGLALVAGVLGTLEYVPDVAWVRRLGLTLQHLRPIHMTFATAWVFLGGVTVVYAYLALRRPGERVLGRPTDRAQWWCWLVAGAGALATLPLGLWSGREYLEIHPVLSVPILAGWLLFAWRWMRATGFRFRDQPAYIYMWNVGICYFIFTFCEAHLFLFDGVSLRPVRDLAMQWKAYGALVGSFNLMVYGSIMWVTSRIMGSETYARSNTAFGLFFVGVLNSFTNYAHHTYHVPQTPVVKWVSFVVSMAEFAILTKVLIDCGRLLRGGGSAAAARFGATRAFFGAATVWTALQLALSLLISVPPLNTIFHGTHVVTAHAMGSMLGIDSMILWGALAWVLAAAGAPDRPTQSGWSVRGAFWLLNAGVLALWAGLLVSGVATGVQRYRGATTLATWIEQVPNIFAITGALAALGIAWLLVTWTVAAWRPARGRSATGTAA